MEIAASSYGPLEGLKHVLAAYATAALEEYARMFLGQRVFTRAVTFLNIDS
jgi:hypothetical protein